MRKIVAVALGFILLIAGGILWNQSRHEKVTVKPSVTVQLHDGTFLFGSEPITLLNGKSTVTDKATGVKKITAYFGLDAEIDINGDGRLDRAFVVTQQTGGSGTFYYLVALINRTTGLAGTDAVLIGDRIVPQAISLDANRNVMVRYLDRKLSEDFTVAPTVVKETLLRLDTNSLQFGIVVQGFEGEADPSRMKLDMTTWVWFKTLYSDGKLVVPTESKKFTLKFQKSGTFSATTDCNSLAGTYTVKEGNLSFGAIAATKMYCANSQESAFTKMLTQTGSYIFTSKGELVLLIKYDSGSIFLR